MAETKDKTERMTEAAETKKSADEKQEKSADKQKQKSTPGRIKESKKLQQLVAQVAELSEENLRLKDMHLRKMAEFENYKKRTEREFLAHLEYANENLLTELLPVIDDFERSLSHSSPGKDEASFREGIELIYKKLMSILSKQGLKVMETVGTEFDPDKHQALMQIETDKYESGYVVEEHLKGYLLNEKVLRHAQVLVAK